MAEVGVRMGAGEQTTLPSPFGDTWKEAIATEDEWARLEAPGS